MRVSWELAVVDANSTHRHHDQPESDRLIRLLREIQLIHDQVDGLDSTPVGDSPIPPPVGDHPSPRKRRSRPAPPLSVRWWSDRTGYPISTLYAAIKRGHLKAHWPQAASQRVEPKDFMAWHEAGRSSNGPRSVNSPGSPPQPDRLPPPAFRHVRWIELPDETPREGGGS